MDELAWIFGDDFGYLILCLFLSSLLLLSKRRRPQSGGGGLREAGERSCCHEPIGLSPLVDEGRGSCEGSGSGRMMQLETWSEALEDGFRQS